jgi:hypothetical protein
MPRDAADFDWAAQHRGVFSAGRGRFPVLILPHYCNATISEHNHGNHQPLISDNMLF